MKNSKKHLLVAFLLATTLFYGQHKPDWDKIKALKIAFLTERLDLSTKEAEVFWPIYNAYETKREALRYQEKRQLRNELKDTENISELEAALFLEKYLTYKEDEQELDEKFLLQVKKVLSAKKTLAFISSEENFKRQLIKQYRENNKRN